MAATLIMARRASLSERLAKAIDNARDPRDRALLSEVAALVGRLTRSHYDMVAALAIADRRGIPARRGKAVTAVAATFAHGWAIDAQGAGQRAHFFRVHNDHGLTLCGLRVRLEWLHYPDERPRCVMCSTALRRDNLRGVDLITGGDQRVELT